MRFHKQFSKDLNDIFFPRWKINWSANSHIFISMNPDRRIRIIKQSTKKEGYGALSGNMLLERIIEILKLMLILGRVRLIKG